MLSLKKTTGWILGGTIALSPIAGSLAGSTGVFAHAAAESQDRGANIHSGRNAVTHYVANLEQQVGQRLVDIKFTGDHSADVHILNDGLKPENKANVDSIKDVFKNNGFDDVVYWAVL